MRCASGRILTDGPDEDRVQTQKKRGGNVGKT